MQLIERDAELDEAGELLTRAAAGTGGAVLISGAMGCGKSELLTALAHRARKQGMLVLDAACSAAEWRSPGGVLNQLLRRTALPPAAPDTAGVPPLLEQVGALTPCADRKIDDDEQVLHPAVTEALRRLVAWVLGTAENTPVLLCVDDVHLADDISVHWLRQLLRQLRSARVALALTECPQSKPVHPRLRAELMRQPLYRRVSLGPLTPGGAARALAEHLGDAAAPLAADAYAASGGNPLLLRALAEDNLGAAAGQRHAADVRLSCGEAYRDMVMSLLHRGAPPLLRLARVLGVLDGDGVVLPGALVDAEPAEVARAEQVLRATGLLDGGRLRGPAARQAVLDSLSAADRSDLHRRAAELLYREGAAGTRVAAHLLACGAIDQPWAEGVLREAAERHLAGNRPAEAHACLDAALRLCRDERERVSLKALLASTAWVLNPSMSAPHLGDLAVALRDGRLPDRHALMLARYLLWHGRFDEAVDAVQRMAEREELCDPGWAVEVRATRELLSASYPVLDEQQERGRRRTRRHDPRAGARFRSDEDPRVRCASALSYVLAHGPDDAVASVAEEAMRAMRLGKNTQEWLMCAVAALGFSDKVEAAGSWCDHWLQESRSRHVPLWVAEFSSLRAGIALREGRPVRARLLAEAALAQVPAESWGVCIGGPLANLVQAATDTGDLEAAAAYLEYSFPEGMFSSRFGLYFLQARGDYHLAAGRPYAALDDLMACGDLMMRWGFDQPTLVPWRSEAARAHVMLNDRSRAYALAREQMDMLDLRPSRARGITLRTLAAASPPAARVALLSEAVEVLQICGDRLQLAGALSDLGRAHIESGRPGRARAPRESALRLAREAGAGPLERELLAELAGSGPAWGRDDGAAFALLSSAERRVAVLAARGHTNKEISQKLVVTVSTVEQHLTRIFRKLGVTTRTQLPAESTLAAVSDRQTC